MPLLSRGPTELEGNSDPRYFHEAKITPKTGAIMKKAKETTSSGSPHWEKYLVESYLYYILYFGRR